MGASAFGGLIELIQPTFNRSADTNDWIADIMGVVLGILCGLMYRRLRPHWVLLGNWEFLNTIFIN